MASMSKSPVRAIGKGRSWTGTAVTAASAVVVAAGAAAGYYFLQQPAPGQDTGGDKPGTPCKTNFDVLCEKCGKIVADSPVRSLGFGTAAAAAAEEEGKAAEEPCECVSLQPAAEPAPAAAAEEEGKAAEETDMAAEVAEVLRRLVGLVSAWDAEFPPREGAQGEQEQQRLDEFRAKLSVEQEREGGLLDQALAGSSISREQLQSATQSAGPTGPVREALLALCAVSAAPTEQERVLYLIEQYREASVATVAELAEDVVKAVKAAGVPDEEASAECSRQLEDIVSERLATVLPAIGTSTDDFAARVKALVDAGDEEVRDAFATAQQWVQDAREHAAEF